jgi:hypothetical protein
MDRPDIRLYRWMQHPRLRAAEADTQPMHAIWVPAPQVATWWAQRLEALTATGITRRRARHKRT